MLLWTAMERTIYRLGAELLSVRQFMEKQPEEQAGLYHALQAMTSAVEVSGLRTRPPGNPDDRFIAEIALGLLCRGWPTLSSPFIEQALLHQHAPAIRLRFEPGLDHEITWHLSENDELTAASRVDFNRALFPIDGRLRRWPDATLRKKDSEAEAQFHDEFLPRLLGPLSACVEWQRPLSTMVEDPDERKKVAYQRADFTLDLPTVGDKGVPLLLNIEVDGRHHECPEQKAKDETRDEVLSRADWLVERIPTDTLTNDWSPSDSIASALWEHPLTRTRTPNEADVAMHPAVASLQLAPHAIARIQLAVLLALRSRPLSLASGSWRLLVREREVPAAHLALSDLRELLTHLCDLYSLPGPPDIEATIETDYPPGQQSASTPPPGNTADGVQAVYERPGTHVPSNFDVAIDVSVLCRPNQYYGDEREADGWLRLRTAYRSAGATPLSWSPPRAVPDPRAKKDALEYLLRACFRKREFRPGQLDIIERALRRQSVIGLLPTGAGKSLTYQLPALLSPGITLVIDPIKSLMQDQVDNLHTTGIDSAVTINSDQTPTIKAASERQLGSGTVRFGFISPERLQIKGFRETLTALCDESPVAFAVIDETHCVSEWGHDFRTPYLNLGRHVRDLMRHENAAPPIIALTGTASRAVLNDVQRETGVTEPDAIIEPDKFDRPELNYIIETVPSTQKRRTVNGMLEQLPARLHSDDHPFERKMLTSGEAGGILFCPHVNGKYGVYELAKVLRKRPDWKSQVDFYCGELPNESGIAAAIWPDYKANVQQRFKRNELSLLAATKAFGMGIDKPNIRYTIHLGVPESTEALMQEMGRAGRDRRPALCHIVFSDREDHDDDDPIHRGISIKDAKARMEAIGWGGDDACRMLYLHTNSYLSADREAIDTRLVAHRFLAEVVGTPASASQADHISLQDGKVRSYLRNEAQLRLDAEVAKRPDVAWQAIRDDPYFDPRVSTDLDRIVYRLTLLGIVSDYTVAYQGGWNDVYSLRTNQVADEDLLANLHGYVRRYRPANYLSEIDKRLANVEGNQFERIVQALCDFVYEEIEAQRREAIWNVRNILRQATDGEHLRRLIGNYFDRSVFRPLVYAIASNDPEAEAWQTIAGRISSESEAAQLLGQSRRALESAPDSSELHFLSSIALAASDTPQASQGAEDLLLGLARQSRLEPEKTHATISALISAFQHHAPAQFEPTVLQAVASTDASVDGKVEAAEDIAVVALPAVRRPTTRQACVHAIVRRLHRAQSTSPRAAKIVSQQTIELLQLASSGELDEPVREILRELRPAGIPDDGYSPVGADFAASAIRHVRDDTTKRACAVLILQDLRHNAQQIV